jgi:arabinofuranosyltransferase
VAPPGSVMGPKSVIIIFLLAAVALAALSLPFYAWTPDDAYISFQYARSFAEGDGFVFNPEERVEGFSNPLWTLLLALLAKLGRDIETTARILSYAAAWLSLGVFMLLLARSYPASPSADRRNTALIMGSMTFAFGSFFPLAFYASSGLETTPYLLCLLIGAAFHLWANSREVEWPHYPSLLAFLAASVMRPEGVGFLLVDVAFLLSKFRRSSGRLLATIFLVFFAYLTTLSMRFEYFGGIVPNTYFAKPSATFHYFAPIRLGLQYLARFLTKSGVALFLIYALVIPQDRRKRYAWFYLWALAAYQVFFIVFVGADVLRFDRFAVPLAPWLYALAAIGFVGFFDGASERGRRFTRRAALVCVFIVVALNAAQAIKAYRERCIHDWMHSHAHRAIGRMLSDLIPPGSEIVTNEIGAIRYYSRRPVIDMLGLTDKTVAGIRFRSYQTYGVGSSPWSTQAVTRYLLDRNPACVLIPSTEVLSLKDRSRYKDTMHLLWYTLLTAPGLEDRYRPVLYIEIHDSKYLYVFLRNDVVFPPAHFAVPLEDCLQVRRLDL